MNRRLAGVLTTIQPRSWRDRYGEEFVALLLEMPASPLVVADTLKHAIVLRRRLLLTTVAASALVIGIGLVAGHHHPAASRVGESAHARTVAAACQTYSSESANGFASTRRCLT